MWRRLFHLLLNAGSRSCRSWRGSCPLFTAETLTPPPAHPSTCYFISNLIKRLFMSFSTVCLMFVLHYQKRWKSKSTLTIRGRCVLLEHILWLIRVNCDRIPDQWRRDAHIWVFFHKLSCQRKIFEEHAVKRASTVSWRDDCRSLNFFEPWKIKVMLLWIYWSQVFLTFDPHPSP